ncbi:MAG: tetratricopeptide repeat protein [Gemmatimonadota bacterium]|nr:tetratricopeptide repeat protein [Gemmatimonadota bacterium]
MKITAKKKSFSATGWQEHWPVLLILAAGLVLRVGYIWSMRGHVMFEPLLPGYDMTGFHEWAMRISSGDLGQGKPYYQAPLYPHLLGILYALAGPDILLAKLLQACLGTASLWLVYTLGRDLFGRGAGLWAAGLMACTPIFPFYEGFFLRVTLVTFLNLLFLRSLVADNDHSPGGAGAALSGALLGLAALARANILVMLPVGMIVFWCKSRQQGLALKALAPALFVLATMLVISPVTLHNRFSGGTWTLVSTNAAENYRIGNSYDSTGGFCYPEKTLAPVLSRDFLSLQVKKIRHLVSDYEQPNNLNFYHFMRYNRLLRLPLLSWGFFLAFGLAGIVISRRRGRQLFPLYAYLVLYGLTLAAFFVTSRFRAPLWPVLIIFSGCAFSSLAGQVRKGKYFPALVMFAAPCLLCLGLVLANDRTITERFFDNMIMVCQARGDTAGEVAELKAKLAAYPEDAPALLRMAHYVQLEGHPLEAIEMVERVLAADPDLPVALRIAGFMELSLGNPSRAKDYFTRYLALVPKAPDSERIKSILSGERTP